MALLPLGNKGPRKPLDVTRYHIQVIMQELLLVFLKQQESQTRAATPSFILCKYVSPHVMVDRKYFAVWNDQQILVIHQLVLHIKKAFVMRQIYLKALNGLLEGEDVPSKEPN
ncbi:hypothetical protein YC2023_038777 [Brassica napus]